MSKHIYLAVTCKTPACKTENLVKYIGADIGQTEIEAMPPTGFEFQCGRCVRQHRYEIPDIHSIRTDSAPPKGFLNGF